MLPRNRRAHKEIFAVLQKNSGKVYRGECFSLRVVDIQQHQTQTVFGVVVSKKAAKKAVMRNRLKRRVRAAIKDIISQYNIKEGCFCIVYAGKCAYLCPPTLLYEQIYSLFKKARVIKQ